MVEPRRCVVLGILLYGGTDEQTCVAAHGIGHIGQGIERKVRQDRSIYMCRGVRIRSGIWPACREWGSIHNGNRRLSVWANPTGRRRWHVQLNAVQTPGLTDRFEISKDKGLAFLDGTSGGPAELVSMER